MPDKIIATKNASESDNAKGAKMTRPLCPYPQSAKYKGTGDTNDAANFECVQNAADANSIQGLSVDQIMKKFSSTAPRALHTPEPQYTKSARKRKIQGTVELSAVIGVDGQAHDIVVVKSLEPSLDECDRSSEKMEVCTRYERWKPCGHIDEA